MCLWKYCRYNKTGRSESAAHYNISFKRVSISLNSFNMTNDVETVQCAFCSWSTQNDLLYLSIYI